jgi:hypothetical protein
MKRHQPALPKLGLTNQEAVGSYVLKAKVQGFGDP